MRDRLFDVQVGLTGADTADRSASAIDLHRRDGVLKPEAALVRGDIGLGVRRQLVDPDRLTVTVLTIGQQ